MTDTTREAASPNTGAQPDEHEGGNLVRLNARTAKRQQLLLAGVGAVLLVGGSWFIFGSDDPKQDGKAGGGETIDTAGLVNRDLSQREFVAVYGNRLDAVSREQKALKDAQLPREQVEAELAALKAENQAMRTDGQAAIDAITAENTRLSMASAVETSWTTAALPSDSAASIAGNRLGSFNERRSWAKKRCLVPSKIESAADLAPLLSVLPLS